MGPSSIAMRPKLVTSFEPIPEQCAIYEYRHEEYRPNKIVKAPSKKSTADSPSKARKVAPSLDYPMYPGLQTAPHQYHRTDATTSSSRMVLNRPRKLSGSVRSTTNGAPCPPYQPTNRNSLSSNWENVVSQEYLPDSQVWAGYVQRRPSTATMTSIQRPQTHAIQPNELFSTLPEEVLHVITDRLKDLHLSLDSDSCATCWMRDLCSLSLSSRRWSKVAKAALYRDIQIIGADSATHKKKLKITQGCRMILLRRTLRANPRLAASVRLLKVPLPEVPVSSAMFSRNEPSPLESYENKVAALVMICPNLEALAGPIPSYDHSFQRIFHALSTRTKLKTMDWRIEQAQVQDTSRPGSSCASPSFAANLTSAQETAFLEHHRRWPKLQTLSIHCHPGASLAPGTLLERTLTCLPSLRHLHLSCLPANSFNDNNLLSLPQLHTLTLSHITGISSAGLSAFATRPNSQALRALHLSHTLLTSLPALARLFSHLTNLEAFSLIQDISPLMPDEDTFSLWMMPYLASSSIAKLHWDITSHIPGGMNDADEILSRSIAARGFPSLRSLRTPNDPKGAFQALCKPMECIASPSDRYLPSSHSAPVLQPSPGLKPSLSVSSKTSIKHLSRSATTMSLPKSFPAPPPHGTDLRMARLAAQSRINAQRQFHPRFHVNIFDEQGDVIDKFSMAGYVGTLRSQIVYNLQPDPGSTDEEGGLVDVPDLAADGGESLVLGKEGCTGSWNWREGIIADKKEKERWWHTERGRWMKPQLEEHY